MKPILRWLGRTALALLLLLALFYAIRLTQRPARTNIQQTLFPGITYERRALSEPRPLLIHTVEIDLAAPGVSLLVTPLGNGVAPRQREPWEAPPSPSERDLAARTTSRFVRDFDVQLAVNGGFFAPFWATSPLSYYPRRGDPVNVLGYTVSSGTLYSTDNAGFPVLCVRAEGTATIQQAPCAANAVQAIAGNELLVHDGVVAANTRRVSASRLHPRTAVAVDAMGKRLWLLVVDGRQWRYSEGMSLAELADLAVSLGAEAALNLDGGGSTALVVQRDGRPRVLNAPFHTRIPLRERVVGNHLGVLATSAE